MDISRCRVICFSPTGSSKTIAKTVGRATGLPVVVSDMTLPAARQNPPDIDPEDLTILSVPVYYGRVAKTASAMIARLRGQGKHAVILVTYGNRAYDDALLELFYLARGSGFSTVAGGAFPARHSFSTEEWPIAADRPDSVDLAAATAFGKELGERIRQGDLGKLKKVPGNTPYKPYPDAHRAPASLDNCTLCGACVEACPVAAIRIAEDILSTDEAACIMCQACVRVCPENARVDNGPGALETKERLTALTRERKEAETFF